MKVVIVTTIISATTLTLSLTDEAKLDYIAQILSIVFAIIYRIR
jgi:hypothetical protein